MSQDIDITMQEDRLFAPHPEFVEKAHISTREQYDEMYKESIENQKSSGAILLKHLFGKRNGTG